MAEKNDYTKAVKGRVTTVRLRTWLLTLTIIVILIFYFLATVVTKEAINWVDFCLICTVQIVIHCAYFPDGDLYGQKGDTFIKNHNAYNEKATKINQDKKIGELREYCKVEFEERKQRYILNECGTIGITLDELEILKQKDEKTIKTLKSYEFVDEDGKSKLIFFSKFKRKRLYKLIFQKLPIEENFPETIMSAVENHGTKSIKDGSLDYDRRMYITKILKVVVLGLVLSYIGYTLRDGVGLAQIISIVMYLGTLIMTAITSFSAGEQSSKIYKNRFYVDLVNFIDGFLEWDEKKGK